ncbi:MAG: dTDP-4-dehydrorhamnose 3,5-epimerase [bacterium]
MDLKVEKTPLEGLLIMAPASFADARGYLAETYHARKYRELGINCSFLQDNQSYSTQGVLRGLHAQIQQPQAKLVRAVTGEIFDVAVDARPNSPTFGQWHGDYLSGANLKQLFIPEGFLHGFCVLSESAIVHYKCSALYRPDDQWGVLWNDPDIGIEWPMDRPILSDKDAGNMSWKKFQGTLNAR